ncbi:hypothetical protein SAMN06265222_1102 [Neorhodopirellula lusitana]|uniref:Ankyrin repeat domain-containing protein n=1 Tax=Neorhodopirellula lusitana TaxID=445327 RepID=A0ABY1QBD6_9BACT|nr:ankyrin [Neorhodopirellula lusitana]SMP66493.1 hypothetical protein SAMN06265222_1102 [Neorhodopirellula lusitana]
MPKIPGVKRTFHQAVGWEAEDFFNDSAVVELCSAIEANDIAKMKRLITEGVDVNAIGEGGATPLLWAFVDNQPERFQLLLERGSDPNVKTTTRLNAPNAFAVGDSVTTLAAQSYFVGPYEAVLQHGGDPSIVGPHKQPLLHMLVRAPISLELKKKRILMAVEHGADWNQRGMNGTIVNTAVAAFQQWELALWLLERGVDPDVYRAGNYSKLVDSVVAKQDRLRPAREAAYSRLIEWLESDGQNINAARRDHSELIAIRSPPARKRFIDRKIREQVRQGLRPDPKLDAEAQDEWYAERRRAKRNKAE